MFHRQAFIIEKTIGEGTEKNSVETMPVFVEVTPTTPLQADYFRSSLYITWNEMHFVKGECRPDFRHILVQMPNNDFQNHPEEIELLLPSITKL